MPVEAEIRRKEEKRAPHKNSLNECLAADVDLGAYTTQVSRHRRRPATTATLAAHCPYRRRHPPAQPAMASLLHDGCVLVHNSWHGLAYRRRLANSENVCARSDHITAIATPLRFVLMCSDPKRHHVPLSSSPPYPKTQIHMACHIHIQNRKTYTHGTDNNRLLKRWRQTVLKSNSNDRLVRLSIPCFA